MSGPLDVGAIVGDLGLLRAASRRDIEMLKVVDEREQGHPLRATYAVWLAAPFHQWRKPGP